MPGPEETPGSIFPEAEKFPPGLFYDMWRGRERTPFYEMAAEGGPEQITHAVRMRCAWMEEMLVIEGQTPNTYPALLMGQELRERLYAIRFSYPLGLAEWPTGLKDKGYDKNPKEREKLVESLDRGYHELLARTALLEKLQEQLAFSADVEQYLFHYFTRLGKKSLPSAYYGTILNSEETHEGFVPLGEKVEKAIDALKEIGEGKASVTLENGKVKRLPNIFGLPPHRGLVMFAFDRYVLPEIKKLRSIKKEDQGEASKALEDFDDLCAAILGLELFRHLDYDVYYCFGRKGSGQLLDRKNITPADWADLNLEIGAATGDSAKAMYFEIRRATEWGRIEPGGRGRREHPRAAGIPMSFGCYPILTAPMLEIVTTEMPVTNGIKQQIKSALGDQKYETPRKITLSVHDQCYNDRTKVPIEVVGSSGETRKQYVEISYTPIPLKEVDWDGTRVINADTKEEWLEFAFGPQTDAFEVPYKLQGFYAFKDMYNQFMRTDYFKLYEEIVSGDTLWKMNKGIEVALGMMGAAYNLSETTREKLSHYVRCVFLGTLAAVLEANSKRNSMENGPQINQFVSYKRGDEAETAIIEAAKISGFLPLDKTGEVETEYKTLVSFIRKNRRAPLPGQCILGGEKFFKTDELEELKPLYPLGLE